MMKDKIFFSRSDRHEATNAAPLLLCDLREKLLCASASLREISLIS